MNYSKRKSMQKKHIITTLVLTLLLSMCSFATIFAEEEVGGIAETTVEALPEATIEETSPQESLSEETSSDETTTEETTTEEITTIPETTTPVPVKTKPWSKNSKGQFVNGKGQIIVGATMKGIDVSKWNGKIDWQKVAASDVDYAIIRCGYGDNIVKQDDEYWAINASECEKYGIPYGVYIYSYATSVKQAKSEAAHVLRLIKGRHLSFPIYYDMEDPTQAKLSAKNRAEIAEAFLNVIRGAGYECGIYANLNWWNNYLPMSLADKVSWKWVAQYNDNACTYTGTYQMWQSTSQGRVDGIKGDVDLNFWFGEVRDILYNIQTPIKVTAPKPVTAPKRVTVKSVKAAKKKATVKWKKLSKAKGYQIQYSKKKSFKKKYTKVKNTKKTSITIKKLTSKKMYYFRMKAYKINSAGKKIYSKKWSKVKRVKIK